MAITAKQLADGQLAATETTMYTVPALTTAYIKSIVLQNTGGGNNTIQLWVKPTGGTSRRIGYAVLATLYTHIIDEPLVLDAGDTLRGAATNATQVDFTVYGAEEA